MLREDARPWCTRGKALTMLFWLRLIAYNLLRFLRHRYLRADASRAMPWDDLRRYLFRALTDSAAWRNAEGTPENL